MCQAFISLHFSTLFLAFLLDRNEVLLLLLVSPNPCSLTTNSFLNTSSCFSISNLSYTKIIILDHSRDFLLVTMARSHSIVQDEDVEGEDWGQADQRPSSSLATKHGRTELR